MSKEEKNIIKLLIKSDEAYSTISKHKEFKGLDNKSLEFHIRSDDYFGTLATILSLLKQSLSTEKTLKEFNLFDRKINELIYLQNNYKIVKK